MSSIAPLSFHVEPQSNILDGLTLYEPVDVAVLDKLINSTLLRKEFNNKQAGVIYENEKQQLVAYRKMVKRGLAAVKYARGRGNPYGRSNPAKALGLFSIRREIRHTLAFASMFDIDVKNCHPEMLNQLCEAESIPHAELDNYVKNRQDCYDLCTRSYGCSEEYVKTGFIMYCYGGGFDSWVKKEVNGERCVDPAKCHASVLKNGEVLELNLMREFRESMSRIHNHAVNRNPDLVKVVTKLKAAKGLGPAHFNMSGSVCSFMLQEYEIRVLEQMYKHALAHGYIKNGVCTLAADGIMLNKYDPCLLADFADLVKATIGFSLVFTQKPMEKGYNAILDDHQIAPPPSAEVKEESGTCEKIFGQLVGPFEKHHTKILNDSVFVKECDGEIVVMSEHNLIVANKHIQCGLNANGSPVRFIDKWLSYNDNINLKDRMEVYPNPDDCPDNVFNLWRPFAMETKTAPYTPHAEGLAAMLHLIRVLCGNEDPVYDYVIGWIAMMIQNPEVKTTCLVFISNEGAGKGTLIGLLKKMLGHNKVLETSTTSRNVWGPFNGAMVNAFLVNLNEMEYSETANAEGQIKALITDSSMTINKKGVNQFKINSAHHFIVTTNKENPIKTTKGDRRKLIARSSDEFKGNHEHFKYIYALLDDEDLIRTCYDYFKEYDLSTYSHTAIPETEYQNDLKELSVSPVEQWLEEFTRTNRHETTLELLGIDIFERFSTWAATNNVKYDTNPLKLGVKLTNLKIPGVDKGCITRKGKHKLFDIPKLAKHFNLE